MKKLLSLFIVLAMAIAGDAQTLNVTVGSVTYQFPSADAGDMVYTGGTTLTIMGKTFTLSEISSMTVDAASVTPNSVQVVYDGSAATVTVAGNVAQYVTPTVSGAHVCIEQSSDVSADNVGEITYTLSGSSTDGEFYMSGSYKATVELNGLTLTNVTPVYSGAAVHVQNGKRINVKVVTGTTNTLTDAASGSQKGCLYVKGHAEFKQKGTLNVYGNVKHGIKAGEYVSVKNATINVLSAAGDGINCSQYFLMESGSLTISGTSDDGIQCDIEDATVGSTGETTDHEDEDSGNMYISGGTITVTCDGVAAKGIKCEGDMNITGGTIKVTTTGDGDWDETDLETKAACGLSADRNINVSAGELTLTAQGAGGKGMKCDSVLTVSGGTITLKTTGGLYYNNGNGSVSTNYTGNTDNIDSKYYSSSKGIKAGVKTEVSTNEYKYGGGIVITGGTIDVSTSGNNAEGIESKSTIYITNGTVTVNSYDDGINSGSDMFLQGGTVTVVAKNNDGIDSNGNIYVSGGTIIACGAASPECGLDAAEGKALYITGGTVLAIGGDNNAVSSKTGSQCVLSTSGNVSANTAVTVKSGTTTLASFTVPSTYTSSSNSGGGFGPGGNQTSRKILVSCAGLTSGTRYAVTVGSSSSNATASLTYSGNGMGGFH